MKYNIALVLALGLSANAFADSYSIDPKHTYPVFEVSHLGFSTQRGRFDKVSGKVVLDPAAGTGSIDVTIDTNSIDMGFEEWNEHMRDAKFFNTKQFPTMTFKADKIGYVDGKPYSAAGTLTLLGVSKPVTLTISRVNCGIHPMLRKEMCGADVSTTLKRSDFGMSAYVPAVGDEIRINIAIEAYKD